MLKQVVPARRGIADIKVSGDFTAEATVFQVIDSSLFLRVVFKLLAIKVSAFFQHGVNIFFLLGLFLKHRCLARNFQSGRIRQQFNRAGKVYTLVIHNKAERIATGATAKAVIELLLLVNAEGRGFFFMERAAGSKVTTIFFQADTAVYHFDYVEAIQ